MSRFALRQRYRQRGRRNQCLRLLLGNERLQQFVIDGVQLITVVGRTAIDDDDHVQFGHHIDELATVTSREERLYSRMLDGLGLVAVAQIVVVDVVAREPRAYRVPDAAQEIHDSGLQRQLMFDVLGGNEALCHVVNPFLAHQLLAVPLAVMQHEQAQFGLALGLESQPPPCRLNAVGRQFPIGLGDVQGNENALAHIIQHRLPSNSRNNHRQGMGTHRVILELPPRLAEIASEPCGQPVLFTHKKVKVGLTASRHHEHIANGEFFQRGRQGGGHLVTQVFRYLVIDIEQAVVHGEPHSEGRDRLAGAIERVQLFGPIRRCVQLADDLAVAQHHQVVDIHVGQS